MMMNKKIFLLCTVLLPFCALGQNSATREKPAWTNGFFQELPYSTIKNFEATGASETEARNAAAAQAIEWQSGATGIRATIDRNNNVTAVTGSDELTVKVRVIDEYREADKNRGYRVYLLVQTARLPHLEFDDITPILKKIYKKNKNAHIWKGNSYLFWNGYEFSYPVYMGSGVSGRFGGVIGIGFRASAGCELGGGFETAAFGYDVGLRLYPYKNWFLSVGYGTMGLKKVSEFNESDGRWGTDGYRQGKAIKIMTGYDLHWDDSDIFLSFNVGIGYDIFMKQWQPVIGISLLGFGGKL
jgi:hypothetical protein